MSFMSEMMALGVGMTKRLRFVLNGCDISFCAEAPADITLEQLVKQCDKIYPDWCACGICSYEHLNFSPETEPEIIIDYDSIKKANDDISCSIIEPKGSKEDRYGTKA